MKFCVFLTLVLFVWPSMAISMPSKDSLQEYRRAMEDLSALVARAEKEGGAEKLKGLNLNRIVRVLSNEEKMLIDSTYSQDKLEVYLEVCDIANRASVALTLFDIKRSVKPSEDPKEISGQMMVLMEKNIVIFQSELKSIQPFLFRCLAINVDNLQNFLQSLPPEQMTEIRINGAAKMRTGIQMVYYSAVATVKHEKLTPEYKETILSALVDVAGIYASAMSLSQRREIHEALKVYLPTIDQSYRTHFVKIIDAFSEDGCEMLCQIK